MPGPTLELNVSVPGLAQVTALSEALDALATKAAGLGIPASAGGLDKHLEHMATQSKSAMQEMQATLATGFAGLAGQIEAFSKTQGRNRNAGVDEAAKTVADQLRIEQAGYEKRLAAAEEFSEAQLRAAKAAGIRLSMGHKLALSSGVSGETGTGADFEAAGGSAAAEMLASQKASAEKKKLLIEDWELANYYQSKFVMLAKKSAAERLALEKDLAKAIDEHESQMLFEAYTRNDHLNAMAKKSAAERLAIEKDLAKAIDEHESQMLFEAYTRNDHLNAMAKKSAAERLAIEKDLAKAIDEHESQMLFEAYTRNDHLNAMAKKSAADRLEIEKALNVAMSNLGRAAVATETFRQASPTSQINSSNMARAKLAAGFTQADVAIAHGFAAAMFNADGALNELSESASASAGPLKTLANNLGSTHSAARGVASGFNAMWLTWGNVGPLLAGAALSHSFMTAVKEGSKLEMTLTSMATLGGQTTDQIASLRKEIDKLSVSGPQGIQDIAVALKTLTLAGLSAAESSKALNAVMQFALAGELPVERAADVLVSVGTAFGYTANAYSYVANMLTSASAASRASVDSMSASIKQATALNATYGVSLKDVTLGIALQAQVGIDYGIAGTSLRNFYADISGRTPKAKKALDELGVSLYHTSGAMKGQLKDLKDLSREIAIGSGGFTDLAKRAEVFNAAFSERGAKPAAAFTKEALKVQEVNGKLMTGVEIMAEKIENNLSIVELAAIRMKLTTQSQMQQTANIFQQAFQEAFTKMQPTLIVITNDLKKIFGSEEFKKSISALVVNLASLVKAMVDYREVIFSVVSAVVAYNTLKFGSSIGVAIGQAATGIATAARAVELGATKTQGLTAAVSGSSAALLAQRMSAIAAAGGLAVVDAATTALTAKVTLATRAMAFFHAATGWLGLIAGVLTAAVSGIALYKMYQGKSNDETKAANISAEEFLANLKEEVKQREAVLAEMKKGVTEQEALVKLKQAENDAIIENQRLKNRKPLEEQLAVVQANRQKFEGAEARRLANGGGGYNQSVALRMALAEELSLKKDIAREDAKAAAAKADIVAQAKKLSDVNKATADINDQRRAKAEKDAAARLKAKQEALDKVNGNTRTVTDTGDSAASALSAAEKNLAVQKLTLQYINDKKTAEHARALAEFAQLKGGEALLERYSKAWLAAKTAAEDAAAATKRLQDQNDFTNSLLQLQQENALLEKGNSLKQARAVIEGGKLGFTPKQVTEKSDLEGQQEKLLAEQEKLKELLKDLEDADPFKGWGKSLAAVFKSSGDAIDQLLVGIRAVDKARESGAKNLETLESAKSKLPSEDKDGRLKLDKAIQAQHKKTAKEELASYATMANGAKKFFKEKSAGYKAMDTMEKALRLGALAEEAQVFIKKLFFKEADVAATVGGNAVKGASDGAYTLLSMGLAAKKMAVDATAALVAQLKLPFPANIPALAATAGILAGLGVLVGGMGSSTSGSPADAEAMQKSQGTGTVFGDPTAKSESLIKALEHLKDIAEPQLKYTAQMAASLRNIESALAGVSGQIVRSSGRITGKDYIGSKESFAQSWAESSGWLTSVVGRLLGGIATKRVSLQDTGVQFSASNLQKILSGGLEAVGYEAIETVKKQLWGLSKKTSYTSSTFGLDPNLTNQFTNIIKDVYASITSANTALGISAEATKAKLAGFTVELGKVSLKGLNSTQIQEQLTAVFGAFSDRLATAATESVSEFQKAGEGYFETLVRVASETELAQSMMDKLGLSMISYKDITYKQSNVVDELVRQSILAVEGLTGIGEVVNGLTGDAAEIAETYTALLSVRYALQAFGSASMSVSASMIAGAGDLDTLAQGAADYTENFLSESERLTKSTSDMARQFARLGVTLPDSNEAFKTLLLGIDGSTEAGQKLYGSVLALSGSFAELSSSAESFDTSKVEMQLAILKAQGKDEQALAIERERILKATDPMLKALQQEVWATEDAAKATQTLTESLNKLNDAGKQISDYLDSLSGQTGAGGLAVSRGTYLSTLSGAKTNDLGALGKITGTASAYLKDAENFSRTSAEYLATVAQVRSELANLEAVKSYKSSLDGSHASGLDYVPFDGYVAQLHKGERVETAAQARQKDEMLAELQAMRVESKAIQTAQATNSLLMRKILDKWDQDGMPAVRT